MNHPRRSPLVRAFAAAVSVAAIAVSSCVREATGPEAARGPRSSAIAIQPVFAEANRLAAGPAFAVVEIDRVRVVLTRLNGAVALDTVITFPAGRDAISVELTVELSPGAPASGESLMLDLAYQDATGQIVFRGGPIRVTAVPAGQPAPPAVEVPVRYVGPGSNAVRVAIAPRTLSVREGDPFAFTATALDGAGAAVAAAPIVWASLDPARATLTSPQAGSGTALGPRGTARIVAQLLTGQADTVVVTVQPRARTLAVVSGGGQTALAGAQLAQPLVVRATASDGLGVAGVPVQFAVASGGGSLGTASAVTDANGLASTTWRLGPAAGAQSVSATSAGLTGSPLSFGASATVIVPTRLVVTAQPGSVAAGDTLATVAFAAQDGAGTTASSFSGPVTLALGSNPAGATLGGTLTVNAVAGVASFAGITVSRAGTAFTFVGSSPGLASATTAAFDVRTGAARQLEFGAYPTAGTAGATLGTVSVVARDAGGNLTPALSGAVTLAIASGPSGGTLGGTTTVQAVNGVATFNGLQLTRSGSYTLIAQSGSLGAASGGAFTVSAGAATALALVSGGGQTGPAAAALPAPIVVEVRDTYGNTVTTAGRAVAFAVAGGGGSVTPPSANTDAQGRASATWTLGGAGGQSLAVSSTGLTPNPLTVTATATATGPSAVSLVFSTQPSNVVAGVAIAPALVVQARDSAGALATSFSGSVTLGLGANPGASALSGTLTVAAVGGVVTFGAVSLPVSANGYTIVAQTASLPTATSSAFNVAPAAAAQLAFVGGPGAAVAGVAVTGVVVQARDAFGNTATGFTGNVTFALGANPGGATLSGTATVAAVAGVATPGTLSLDKAAAGYTLTAASAGLVGATSPAFTVSANTAAQLVFTVQPSAVTAGVVMTPAVQVTVQDAYGNVSPTGSTVTVAIGTNPSNGILSGTRSQAQTAGVATFSDLSVSAAGSGYTLTASAGPLGPTASASFDVASSGPPVIAWTNAAGGSWSTPSNWSLGRVPNATDSVVIALAGTYTVTLDTTFTAAQLVVGGGASGVQTLAITNRTLKINGAMVVGPSGQFSASASAVTGSGTLTNQGAITAYGSTINAAFSNQGTMTASGASSINGALTNAAGAVLNVGQLDGSTSLAILTVANGFTNSGTINLTVIFGAAYSSQLTVSAGTLVNAPGATIAALGGAAPGGSRLLAAQLNNQGTLTVGVAMTITRLSATHTNSGTIDASAADLTITQAGTTPQFTNTTGTITVGAGRTLTMSGGTFTNQAGATLTGGGTLTLSSMSATFAAGYGLGGLIAASSTVSFATAISSATVVMTLTNSTVNGAGSIVNPAGQSLTLVATTVNVPVDNQGTLTASGASAINGTLTNAGSLNVGQVDGSTSLANLTVANGFTNSGTINLTVIFGAAYSSQLTVTTGTLVNAPGATIAALGGAAPGGNRTLAAQLDNQGAVMAGVALTISKAGATHTNGGTIDVSAANLTITPSLTHTAGTITVGAGRTLAMSGGTFTSQAGATLTGGGTLTLSSMSATFAAGYGLAALSATASTVSFATTISSGTIGLTLTNSTVNGAGSILNPSGQSLTLIATTINVPVDNQGTLTASGASAINGTLTNAGVLNVGQVDGSTSLANLTVANGFTNSGTINLTVTFAAAYSSQLTVTSGTLVNAPGATIAALGGAAPGGNRTLAAQLDNQSTVTAGVALTISKAGATHTNSGNIDASAANLTITPSLTNTTGTITVGAGRTLAMSGGTLTNQAGATLTGGGTLTLSSMSATFAAGYGLAALSATSSTVSFATTISSGTTGLTLTNSTVNGAGSILNPSGQTLTLIATTINIPVDNQGTLIASGASAINGTLTQAGVLNVGQVDGSTSLANLTVGSGFTNTGTINLTVTFAAAYSSQLTVTTGTLVNAPGATIAALGGAAPGGNRTLAAQLDNQGAVTAGVALTISKAGATHTNSGTIDVSAANLTMSPSLTHTAGTITVGAGRTLSMSGGTFTSQAGGTLTGTGTLSLSSMSATFAGSYGLGGLTAVSSTVSLATTLSTAATSLTLTGSTVNGAGSILNQGALLMIASTINVPLDNQGGLTASGASAINGALTNSGVLSVGQVDGSTSLASLTVASGFTNTGSIRLTVTFAAAYSSQLTVTTGTLVNAPGATIATLSGVVPGGTRTLNAQLDNQGTLTLNPGAAGTLTLNGSLTTSGSINMDLGGLTFGTQYDRLVVNGATTLGGALNVALFGGFVPASGNAFTVMTYPSVTGGFSSTSLPPQIPSATVNPTTVVLTTP